MMIRRISVCVHDRNAAIDEDADAVVVGLGDWAVAAMASEVEAEQRLEHGALGRPVEVDRTQLVMPVVACINENDR